MSDEIKRAQRRALQYQYADGSFEFKVGLTMLILAIYSAVTTRGVTATYVLLAGLVLISGGGWLIDRLIRLFKENVTYRRSGYVSPLRNKEPAYPPDTILLFVVLGFCAWAILISYATDQLGDKLMPLLAGVIQFVILLVTAVRSGAKRFYFLAAIGLGMGIILALVNHGQWNQAASEAIFFFLMGLIFLFSGGVTLRNYLRSHPTVEDPGFGNE